jgi:hypothetical protein
MPAISSFASLIVVATIIATFCRRDFKRAIGNSSIRSTSSIVATA